MCPKPVQNRGLSGLERDSSTKEAIFGGVPLGTLLRRNPALTPAYVYDLDGSADHRRRVRARLSELCRIDRASADPTRWGSKGAAAVAPPTASVARPYARRVVRFVFVSRRRVAVMRR